MVGTGPQVVLALHEELRAPVLDAPAAHALVEVALLAGLFGAVLGRGVCGLRGAGVPPGGAGDKGEGGPSDSSTGYMAPVAMVSLPPDGTYAYTFYLVLGDVDTIRAYAQQVQAEYLKELTERIQQASIVVE